MPLPFHFSASRLNFFLIVSLLLALTIMPATVSATETENNKLNILPTPGKVVIDGKINDWNLAGSLFICSDVENYRDQFASWQSAMYDADNLYLLSRWVDTTPMNNPGLAGSDMGFAGDCLQVRFIVNAAGAPMSGGNDPVTQKTSHITAWYGRDGRDIIDIAYGKRFDEGNIKDAKKSGAQQAFVKDPNEKGYIQEISIPWKLISNGFNPKVGDTIIMTYEPNFSTTSKMRVSTKDLFRAGVTPDRVFAFMSYDRWGEAIISGTGKIEPISLRLADSRVFPINIDKSMPLINWNALYKDDKLEGFAKIKLNLPDDGFVSLIIKNAEGRVVRNLLNAKFMTRGNQEILWDGLTTPSDKKPGEPVPAGDYTWEAICHKGIGLSLVGWASNSGKTPYDSPQGNWGGDMGGPCTVDNDNDSIYLGWGASEAGKALVCTDFNGNVKWRHKRGGFGGAALVTASNGIVYVYDRGQGNTLYRLNAKKGEYINWEGTEEATLELSKILGEKKPADTKDEPALNGLVATNGKLFLTYKPGNALFILNAATGKVQKIVDIQKPTDIKTGSDGKLYLLYADSKIAVVNTDTGNITDIITDLKNAKCVTADKESNIFVGMSEPVNQVFVYDKSGKFIRAIGKEKGRQLTGLWEKDGMRFVNSVKIDPNGKLWVMEADSVPRRISVWNAQTGAFDKEFFGPTDYGAGGGAICPTDPLTEIGHGCEWKINKETGKADCVAVIYRGRWANARFGKGKDNRVYAAVGGGWAPHYPVNIFERISAGKWKIRTTIWTDEETQNFPPKHINVWSDANDDQQQQPEEIKKYELDLGGWIDGWYLYFNQSMYFSGGKYNINVTGWTACGAPEYDLTKATALPLPEDFNTRGGMGAQKDLVSEDGIFVIYNGHYGTEHSDFPCYNIKTGKKIFAYPNNYVGVHGGHLAPPAKTGLIRGAYDIVGTAKMQEPLGNIFVIGTDKGEWHILSESGYYVSSLFEGDPMKIKWPDEAVPGANMNCVPPGMGAEDFGGSIMKADDGNLYVQAGKTAFINCKVNGLETVKIAGSGNIKISVEDTIKAQDFKIKYLSVSDSTKSVSIKNQTVNFTGNPDKDFGNRTMSYGPDNASINTWLAHDNEKIYAAWRVNDKTPWVNGATGFDNMYACGDTVDFQIGINPDADKKRRDAVSGDLRISIGQLQGKNTAVIYRKVFDEKAPKTFYSGVWRNGYIMEFVKILDNVKIETKIQPGKSYIVEVAIPMQQLGITIKPVLKLTGDVGATFSDPEGKDTNQRIYWSNQAAGIVADEVEELKMQPGQWGEFILE